MCFKCIYSVLTNIFGRQLSDILVQESVIADLQWMFRAFRIGFSIIGRNYSDQLRDMNSLEYRTTAAEILSQVSLSIIMRENFFIVNFVVFYIFS